VKQLFLTILFLFLVSRTTVYPSNTKVTSVAAFNTALSGALAGDTITLANQTWQNAVINFSGKNGTSTLPIVLRAETFDSVIFTGNCNLRIGGNYLIVEGLTFQNAVSASSDLVQFQSNSGTYANHSRLTKFAFINCNPPNATTSYRWVSIYGMYNRMDHCYFSGKNHSGPTFSVRRNEPNANYALIDSNYFAYRPNLGVNGGETIQIGTGTYSLYNSSSVIEYNLFERCNGEIETISNKSCENIIRYNTFLNNEGTITLRQGRRCQVYGNFLLGNGTSSTGGIRVHGDDHKIYNNYFSGLQGDDTRSALSIENGYVVTDTTAAALYFPVRRLLVAFNTFVNNRYNINIGIAGDALSVVPPDSITFANNVIRGTNGVTQSPLILQVDTATNITWASNLFYGNALGIAPVPVGINTIDDPLLNLQSDNFYRPALNSPLIDSAKGSYTFVTTDMDGQMRETLADIGADEVTNAPVTIKPVTSNHVGPYLSHTIMVYKNDNGIVTPGTTSVRWGENQRFVFSPNTGYSMDSVFVDGVYIPDSTSGYTFYNVRQNHEIVVHFSIILINLTTEVTNQWNLISVPLQLQNYLKDSLFPTATTNAYSFSSGYIAQDTLDNGIGYWLKFPNADSVVFTGIPIYYDTIDVISGWNLIGSISEPTSISSITTVPENIISSNYYGYSFGYLTAKTLEPGKGYWIKVNQLGKIILGSSGKR
jgi:poly(beta-D-mannuronate) lyase